MTPQDHPILVSQTRIDTPVLGLGNFTPARIASANREFAPFFHVSQRQTSGCILTIWYQPSQTTYTVLRSARNRHIFEKRNKAKSEAAKIVIDMNALGFLIWPATPCQRITGYCATRRCGTLSFHETQSQSQFQVWIVISMERFDLPT